MCASQGVSVEAVDPVFQAKMLDMLKQTGRYGSTRSSFLNLLKKESQSPTRVFTELNLT